MIGNSNSGHNRRENPVSQPSVNKPSSPVDSLIKEFSGHVKTISPFPTRKISRPVPQNIQTPLPSVKAPFSNLASSGDDQYYQRLTIQGSKYPKYLKEISSLKMAEQASLKSKNGNGWLEAVSIVTDFTKSDVEKDDKFLDRVISNKKQDLLKGVQSRSITERVKSLDDYSRQTTYCKSQQDQIQYNFSKNKLQIIEQTDQKTLNDHSGVGDSLLQRASPQTDNTLICERKSSGKTNPDIPGKQTPSQEQGPQQSAQMKVSILSRHRLSCQGSESSQHNLSCQGTDFLDLRGQCNDSSSPFSKFKHKVSSSIQEDVQANSNNMQTLTPEEDFNTSPIYRQTMPEAVFDQGDSSTTQNDYLSSASKYKIGEQSGLKQSEHKSIDKTQKIERGMLNPQSCTSYPYSNSQMQSNHGLQTPQSHTIKVQKKSSDYKNSAFLSSSNRNLLSLNLKNFTYDSQDQVSFTTTPGKTNLDSYNSRSPSKSFEWSQLAFNKPGLRLDTFGCDPRLDTFNSPINKLQIQRLTTVRTPTQRNTLYAETKDNRPFTHRQNPTVQEPFGPNPNIAIRRGISLSKKNLACYSARRNQSPTGQYSPATNKINQQPNNHVEKNIPIEPSPESAPIVVPPLKSEINLTAPQASQDRLASPQRRLVKLGSKNIESQISPRKGIKLLCEFRKPKNEEKRKIQYLK